MSEAADPLIGCRFGAYVVEGLLGAGGMGRVYRARHEALGRMVALKILPSQVASDEQYMQRFIREAKLASSMQHPNIVQVFDFGSNENGNYIAMELVDGASVGDVIKASGRIPEKDLMAIAYQALGALGHAHDAGIVHRDVKPDNLLICKDGTLKLADLGLAKANLMEEDQSLTMSGMILGTPHYMPPEQIQESRNIDGRADLYALGATLFHCATGRTPYTGETSVVIMNKHISDPVPEPRFFTPGLSEDFSRLIMRLMQKSPEYRFATAFAASKVLEGIMEGKGTAAAKQVVFIEEASVWDRVKEWAPTLAILALLTGIGIFAWKWMNRPKPVVAEAAVPSAGGPEGDRPPLAEGPSRPLAGPIGVARSGSGGHPARVVRVPEGFLPAAAKDLIATKLDGIGFLKDGILQGVEGQPGTIISSDVLTVSSTQRVYLQAVVDRIVKRLKESFNQAPDVRRATLIITGRFTSPRPPMTLKLFRLEGDPIGSLAMSADPIAMRTLRSDAASERFTFDVTDEFRRILKDGQTHGWVLATSDEGEVVFPSMQPSPDEVTGEPPFFLLEVAVDKALLPEQTRSALTNPLPP